MPDMTIQEFADKLVTDKAFKKEVIGHCFDVEVDDKDKHALGKWLKVGAERMGYDFDGVKLQEEIMARVNKLNAFKKIAFMGSLITTANKAKKAGAAGK